MLEKLTEQLLPPWKYRPDTDQQGFFDGYKQAVSSLSDPGPAQDGYSTTLLGASQRIYDSEVARRESINTRCGAVLSTGGILGTLVVAAGQLGLAQKKGPFDVAAWATLALFIVSLLYIGTSITMALAVQGARQGSAADPTDLPPDSAEETKAGVYSIRMAKVYLRYTIANYELNNILKSRLHSGQRCLRNGIIAIIVAGMLSPVALREGTTSASSSPPAPSCRHTHQSLVPRPDLHTHMQNRMFDAARHQWVSVALRVRAGVSEVSRLVAVDEKPGSPGPGRFGILIVAGQLGCLAQWEACGGLWLPAKSPPAGSRPCGYCAPRMGRP
jgi:hypothetical protein